MIDIQVKYKFFEHVKLLEEIQIEKLSQVLTSPRWYHKLGVKLLNLVMLTFVFPIKIYKVGRVSFFADENNFQRTAKAGVSRFNWSEIKEVKVYSNAYVITTQNDTSAPIPFRCINAEERKLFEKYAADRLQFTRPCA